MSLPPQHHSSISLRFNYKKRCGAFLAHPHLFFLSLGFYIIVLKPFYCFFAGCASAVTVNLHQFCSFPPVRFRSDFLTAHRLVFPFCSEYHARCIPASPVSGRTQLAHPFILSLFQSFSTTSVAILPQRVSYYRCIDSYCQLCKQTPGTGSLSAK